MNEDVSEVRKQDRFLAASPIAGTFGGMEVSVLNVSVGGAQLLHAQPVRIGTTTRLHFGRGETVVAVEVRVLWSHLLQTDTGLRYRTGVALERPDVPWAAAINALVRTGQVARDPDSLERKRQREEERELRRKSSPKLTIPPSGS